jgi:predicted homoserine dehydrogenase-like protein
MISEKLAKRAQAGNPIKVGWVGAGRMNTGAICQTASMKGIFNSVICDLRVDAAVRAYEINGFRQEDILVTNDPSAANDAVLKGKPVVTETHAVMPELVLDCIVEGTGIPEVGAEVAYRAILGGKNIILLNVETDVVIGPILHRLAERAGVVYSVSSGDEPGLITELVDRYGGLGFEVVAVGKSPVSLAKMDRYATPDTVAEDGRLLDINPHILVTFRDGTKTSIEMSSISNATGLVPDVCGMHGPTAGIQDMAKLFCLREEGGILHRRGVVDYARPLLVEDGSVDFVHSVTPGVFLVLRTTHPQLQHDLEYWNVIHSGEYYTFYTPYHLASNELPLSIVWAVEDHEPTVVPRHGLVTEVIGAAKGDIKAGTVLRNAYHMYALNDRAEITKRKNFVPFGLLENAKAIRDIKKDEIVRWEMIEPKNDTALFFLRKLQDQLLDGKKEI